MRKTKIEKGITLIALIITIVILLILAVVAITSIQSEGIFAHAENAANKWNKSVEEEQGIIGRYEEILNNIEENSGKETLVGLWKAGKLPVGTYVDYKPVTEQSSYTPDGKTVGSLTGYTSGELQTITRDETLNWRVLGYDAEKDELLLISGAPTTQGIQFYGATGYNNYEDVLNDTCSALYSNSTIGATSRSVKMEDIDKYLGGDAYTKENYGGGSSKSGGYGYRNENISSRFEYDKDNKKLTRVADDGSTTLNLTSDAYYYITKNIITDTTKLELVDGTTYDDQIKFSYLLASRSLGVYEMDAKFCGGRVAGGKVCLSDTIISLLGSTADGTTGALRPVVRLEGAVTTDSVPVLGSAPGSNGVTGKDEIESCN